MNGPSGFSIKREADLLVWQRNLRAQQILEDHLDSAGLVTGKRWRGPAENPTTLCSLKGHICDILLNVHVDASDRGHAEALTGATVLHS